MNISAYGHKFFIFSGILLMVIALVQFLTRPRGKRAEGPARLMDPATIKMIVFATVGLLGLLAGLGVFPMPGDK
jgi:uncharacterized membrane protein YfcA